VQITHSVPPEALFSEYLYFSSFSDTLVKHARSIACRLIDQRELGPHSLVVELASNDGYLLQHYRDAGVPVLGIEPAANIAKVAVERDIPTRNEFFGREVGERMAENGERCDVLHANNVLAHVPDLNGFVAGIREVLKEDGVAVIEAPYVKPMIDHVEFDTIYHEHLCYFSLTTLVRLFRRNGLTIFDVEQLPIHGGSLRIFAGRAGRHTPSVRVRILLDEEADWGVDEPAFYADYARRVEDLKGSLVDLLHTLKLEGKSVAAYGAAAKGSTLLNYMGIGRDLIDYVVDRSTYKQGRYMPGVRLPIHAPSKLLDTRPDHCLLLTWNFADEIMEQQSEYRALGGKFIIPVPEVKVA
jgi:SAM-dependent methyltransferase